MDDPLQEKIARELFRNSNDVLFLFDPPGRMILEANPAALRLTGFDPSEVRGLALETLFPPLGAEGGAGPSLAATADGTGDRHPRWVSRGLRRRSGAPLPVTLGLLPVALIDRPLGLAIARDGGAAGDSGGESGPSLLDRFFDLAPDLFGIGRVDGRIVKVNAAWRQVLGHEDEELLDANVWDFLHPDDRAVCAQAGDQLAEGRMGQLEVRLRHKDGSYRRIAWRLTFAAGLLHGVGRDVTELRRGELLLHRARSEFLAHMSHEIRTPMTAILGFADLLLVDPALRHIPSHALGHLGAIRRNADLLLGIFNDILDLSRIEADDDALAVAPCAPAEVVAEAVALMRVRAEDKGLALTLERPTALPASIRTDAARLRQVLINLIGNAIKFTERGRVAVRARLAGLDGEARLEFEVEDTGIGIAADHLASIFRPFERVHTSQSRAHGGTGLGLTISRRLAERLGGAIGVRSTPGVGSTFTLTVAAAIADDSLRATCPAEPPPAAPGAAAPARRDGACRLLLAEDNRDNQRVVSLRLALAGAEVTIAPDGQVAVDRALAAEAEGRPFDLILMDMQMPILDGYEATRLLRARGYRRPILALTAHALAEDRAECLRLGCDEFVSKPIDWERLLGLIGRYSGTAGDGDGDGDGS